MWGCWIACSSPFGSIKYHQSRELCLEEGEKMEIAFRLKFTKGKPYSLQFFYSEEIDSRASMFPFVKP